MRNSHRSIIRLFKILADILINKRLSGRLDAQKLFFTYFMFLKFLRAYCCVGAQGIGSNKAKRSETMNQYRVGGGIQIGMSIQTVLKIARSGNEGPQPRLDIGGELVPVHQNKYAVIDFDNSGRKLLAFGLDTCAGVVVVSTHQDFPAQAVVYHAGAGVLNHGILSNLRRQIGKPPKNSLLAIYTNNRKWDDNYNKDALELENYGIPANNVAFIAKWGSHMFGINSFGQVGY
jgi:hypothetical protein